MTRLTLTLAAALLAASPALAQTTTPPAAPAAPAAPPKDVPMARLMSDGAQVRGIDSKDRIVLQLGKFVFVCKFSDDKPATCDLVP